MASELKEEHEINTILRADQSTWSTQNRQLQQHVDKLIDEHKLEVDALNEQLRDIMFHFEAQQKLASASDDSSAAGAGGGGGTEHVTQHEIEQAVIEIGPAAKGQRRKKK